MIIINDRKLIKESNYWESEMASRGLFMVSINDGHIRLLVPNNCEHHLVDMFSGARKIIILALPVTKWQPGKYCVKVVFEDYTDRPFFLNLSPGAFLGIQPGWKHGQKGLNASIWISKNGQPQCYATLPVDWTVHSTLNVSY
jgi:hypothetical protein